MRNYDKVEIEVIRLASTDNVSASGEIDTEPKLCGSCGVETTEDCIIVSA